MARAAQLTYSSMQDSLGWPADLSDDQILEKLLALDLERANEEEKSARTKKPKTSRDKQEDGLI